MNATEQGAWVVAIYKVISGWNVDDASFDPLEVIITAGRAADLVSTTRSLGTVQGDQLLRRRPSNQRIALRKIESYTGDTFDCLHIAILAPVACYTESSWKTKS